MSADMTQQDDIGIFEEEEEVEITDTEDGIEVENEDDEENSAVETPSKAPEPKPAPTSSGKVKPSQEVKNLKMKTPEAVSKAVSSTLPTGKNPFTTFGMWKQSSMSEIEIVVPVLTGKNETTNELTRANKPEARYWRAPIVFKYGNYTSTTLRFDNVAIPYHTGKGYGSSFVYLCLPGFVADMFSEAGRSRRPTIVTEKSLLPDKNRWWKIANNVEDSFGVISNETKKFHKKSLEVIFDGTSSGITATVVLSFHVKANTDSKEPLKPTTSATVSVNLEKAFITATDVNVQMPTRINTKKTKVDPTATSKDVADDSLMKRLSELGL